MSRVGHVDEAPAGLAGDQSPLHPFGLIAERAGERVVERPLGGQPLVVRRERAATGRPAGAPTAALPP